MARQNLSRRGFLARTAGIAGVSMGFAGRASGGEEEGRDAIRVGFLGVGDRGRQLLASVLRLAAAPPSPRVEVEAIADLCPKNLRRALAMVAESGRTPRGVSDHRRLLDWREIDAVFIATPVYLHVPQLLDALAAGKHVYCEKPLFHRIEDGRRVLAAARDAQGGGRVLQVGFQRRYSPRYQEAISRIHAGEFGRVVSVEARWHTTAGLPRDKAWLRRREKSGGIILEQGVHQLDVCNWILRAPPRTAFGVSRTAEGVVGGDSGGGEIGETYFALLEWEGGVRGTLSYLGFAAPERRFAGIGEIVHAERAGIDLAAGVAHLRGGKRIELAPRVGNETDLSVAAFFRSVCRGSRPVASVEEAYLASLSAILCDRAAAARNLLRWEDVAGAAT